MSVKYEARGMGRKREQMCALKLSGIMTEAEQEKYSSISHIQRGQRTWYRAVSMCIEMEWRVYRKCRSEELFSLTGGFDCLRVRGAGVSVNNERDKSAANIKRNMASG